MAAKLTSNKLEGHGDPLLVVGHVGGISREFIASRRAVLWCDVVDEVVEAMEAVAAAARTIKHPSSPLTSSYSMYTIA